VVSQKVLGVSLVIVVYSIGITVVGPLFSVSGGRDLVPIFSLQPNIPPNAAKFDHEAFYYDDRIS
jgi:hypothetical protein